MFDSASVKHLTVPHNPLNGGNVEIVIENRTLLHMFSCGDCVDLVFIHAGRAWPYIGGGDHPHQKLGKGTKRVSRVEVKRILIKNE